MSQQDWGTPLLFDSVYDPSVYDALQLIQDDDVRKMLADAAQCPACALQNKLSALQNIETDDSGVPTFTLPCALCTGRGFVGFLGDGTDAFIPRCYSLPNQLCGEGGTRYCDRCEYAYCPDCLDVGRHLLLGLFSAAANAIKQHLDAGYQNSLVRHSVRESKQRHSSLQRLFEARERENQQLRAAIVELQVLRQQQPPQPAPAADLRPQGQQGHGSAPAARNAALQFADEDKVLTVTISSLPNSSFKVVFNEVHLDLDENRKVCHVQHGTKIKLHVVNQTDKELQVTPTLEFVEESSELKRDRCTVQLKSHEPFGSETVTLKPQRDDCFVFCFIPDPFFQKSGIKGHVEMWKLWIRLGDRSGLRLRKAYKRSLRPQRKAPKSKVVNGARG